MHTGRHVRETVQQIFAASTASFIVLVLFAINVAMPNRLGTIGEISVVPIFLVFYVCPLPTALPVLALAILVRLLEVKLEFLRPLTGAGQIMTMGLIAGLGWRVRELNRQLHQQHQQDLAERQLREEQALQEQAQLHQLTLVAQREQQANAKLRWLNSAAHHLRTPITVFRGYLDTLRDLGAVKQNPVLSEALTAMDEKAEEMNRLVEDMLTNELPQDEITDQLLEKEEI